MVQEETRDNVWLFANAVESLGFKRNVATGRVAALPSNADNTVATYKHEQTGRRVCVWPIENDQDAHTVGAVADRHGLRFVQYGRPQPRASSFTIDHAPPVDLSGVERAYVGLRGPMTRGHSGLQVWVVATPPTNIPIDHAGQIVSDRLERDQAYPLPARLDLAYRSPTGFECGYAGSGPHQLAVAIAADLFGDTDAGDPRIVSAIVHGVITGLPADRHWLLTEAPICKAIEQAWEAAS